MVHATAASSERQPYTKAAVTDLLEQARNAPRDGDAASPAADVAVDGRAVLAVDGNR